MLQLLEQETERWLQNLSVTCTIECHGTIKKNGMVEYELTWEDISGSFTITFSKDLSSY